LGTGKSLLFVGGDMPTVRIVVSGMQATDYSAQVPGVVLHPGSNDVEVYHWLDLREYVKPQIDGGYVSVDPKEEATAIESFRSEWFAKFKSLGVPAVKVAAETGDFSKGALHKLAMEWLLSKTEEREDGRDEQIRRAAILSAAATIIAAWIAIKFGK
ncbi:MAG: hypothetical protein P4L87_06580, partial [Formivibrio sp.]|nr:hypothetical protein [Formivibrio sp.]